MSSERHYNTTTNQPGQPILTARQLMTADQTAGQTLGTPQLITAIARGSMPEATERLPHLLEHEFHWFCDENKQAAISLFESLRIAFQHDLPRQIELYQQQLLDSFAQDLAACTQWLVSTQLGYNGPSYTYPRLPLPEEKFWVPIPNGAGSPQYLWVYDRLEDFPKLIPPSALHVLPLLESEGISPQAFWVADLLPYVPARFSSPHRSHSPRQSLDPVLSAQFGRYFVALAYWE